MFTFQTSFFVDLFRKFFVLISKSEQLIESAQFCEFENFIYKLQLCLRIEGMNVLL